MSWRHTEMAEHDALVRSVRGCDLPDDPPDVTDPSKGNYYPTTCVVEGCRRFHCGIPSDWGRCGVHRFTHACEKCGRKRNRKSKQCRVCYEAGR